MKKKILSMILAVMMLVSAMPMSAIAREPQIYSSGEVIIDSLKVGDIVARGATIKGAYYTHMGYMKTFYIMVNGVDYSRRFIQSPYNDNGPISSDNGKPGKYVNQDECVRVVTSEDYIDDRKVARPGAKITVEPACDFTEATCYSLPTCKICGRVEGEKVDHEYTAYGTLLREGDCTTPALYNAACKWCGRDDDVNYSTFSVPESGHDFRPVVKVDEIGNVDVYSTRCVNCGQESELPAKSQYNIENDIDFKDINPYDQPATGISVNPVSDLGAGTMKVMMDGKLVATVSSSEKYTIPYCVNVDEKSLDEATNTMTLKLTKTCVYTFPTCTEVPTCVYCHGTEGDALGHTWVAATCQTPETCSVCGETRGTVAEHSYTVKGTLDTDATCTTPAIYNAKCQWCDDENGTMTVGAPLGHDWQEATIFAPMTCDRCKLTNGKMLPSADIKYVNPVTNEDVEYSLTNDNVNTLFKTPMQYSDNIFLGWHDGKNYLSNNITQLDKFTNITAGFTGVGRFYKDINDEKNIESYKDFELAGVQIRPDYCIDTNMGEAYGGMRFIGSLSEDLLSRIGYGNIIEYGFVTATFNNALNNAFSYADINGYDYREYTIKNGDKNVKRINCYNGNDHRTFDGYRLFTMVIDYQGNEDLKDQNIVARAYVAYYDQNGVARIYYSDYDGTNFFGGCSISYNRAVELSKQTV